MPAIYPRTKELLDHIAETEDVHGIPDTTELALKDQAKGFVNHGANANTSRPDYVSVEWFGSVEPINAIDGDTWIDTTV